jgi:hypothetical protein
VLVLARCSQRDDVVKSAIKHNFTKSIGHVAVHSISAFHNYPYSNIKNKNIIKFKYVKKITTLKSNRFHSSALLPKKRPLSK